MNIIKDKLLAQGPEFFSHIHFPLPATVRDKGEVPALALQGLEGLDVLLEYAIPQSDCVVPVNGNPFGRLQPPNTSTSALSGIVVDEAGQAPFAFQFFLGPSQRLSPLDLAQKELLQLVPFCQGHHCFGWPLVLFCQKNLGAHWLVFLLVLFCQKNQRPLQLCCCPFFWELLEELLLMFQSGGDSTPVAFLASLSCSPFSSFVFSAPFFF